MAKILATLMVLLCVSSAHALEQGKTDIHGYIGFVFFDDRGIGWSGSETTFDTRLKLDLQHALYDDILLRFRAEYIPTIHNHSRAYSQMRQREGNLEDSYMQFNGSLLDDATVRVGVVKVPFGVFNTFSVDDRNRPVSMRRWREWDYGFRIDKRIAGLDVAFAIVNGEGASGTDANSSKSASFRIGAPRSADGDGYAEVQEITNYPNPLLANPEGNFDWDLGLSYYVGNRYTTPIKQKNTKVAVDYSAAYGRYALKGQASYMLGGFNNRAFDASGFANAQTLNLYGGDVTYDIETYPTAVSWFTEVTAGISEKTMIGVTFEYFDPDSGSGHASPKQSAKERTVIGLKHDLRPGVTSAIFYTINNNPAFGETGNILESDYWKGDDVLMVTLTGKYLKAELKG